jgi:hypothetical protein
MNTRNGLFLVLAVLVLALVALVGTTNQTQAATEVSTTPIVLDLSNGNITITTTGTFYTEVAEVDSATILHYTQDTEGMTVTVTPQTSLVETGTYVDYFRTFKNSSGVPVDTDWSQALAADGAALFPLEYRGQNQRLKLVVTGSGTVTPTVVVETY